MEGSLLIRARAWMFGGIGVVAAACVVGVLALMWWWDYEPAHFDVSAAAQARATASSGKVVTGSITTSALMTSAETLLDKRGGYLSNDRFPPGVLMDNVPNWEFGVLTATRDLARALRNDFSRSQTQSVEDKDLQEADPLFSSPNDRWLLPSSESQYRKAIAHGIERDALRLQQGAAFRRRQFLARLEQAVDDVGPVATDVPAQHALRRGDRRLVVLRRACLRQH